MWTKPEQQTVDAVARPIRVAYLVDLAACPDALLNAVFAEAYSRWGGRRTLIVPANTDGIDTRYAEWLLYFDADIIYSFVALNDESVFKLHEQYAPAHLTRHRERGLDSAVEREFRIELPLTGLASLSVLPAFLSRSWSFDGPPRNLKLLTRYRVQSESSFLQENFGFLSASFPYGSVGSTHPDLYSVLALVSDENLADRTLRTDEQATLVTSEDQVLEALGAADGPVTLAELSDYFAPFLDVGRSVGPAGTCIVIGDTPADRLLFWNMHHLFERSFHSEITSLRIPVARAGDEAFLARIKQILRIHGSRGNNGQRGQVGIHSCSLDLDVLEEIAGRLRQGNMWLAVTVERHVDHAALVPGIEDSSLVRHRFGGVISLPESRGSVEFHGKRAPVPLIYPWHIKEVMPPAGLRSGNWMLDLSIDREVDHCRYANQRHAWRLPRRLRIERAFDYEREGARGHDLDGKLIRVVRSGILGVAINMNITRASVAAPEDLAAFRFGICNDWEWIPFSRDGRDGPPGRLRFAAAEYSDKGRYMIGVLQLFDSIPDAFSVLMHGYWRDVLHHLGGVTADAEPDKQKEFLRKLRKSTVQLAGPLNFETDDQQVRMAGYALHHGRMMRREKRYIQYGQLLRRWLRLVRQYIDAHPTTGEHDPDDHIRDVRLLNRSVQYLCQHEVLFQGREWRCRSCNNRNWVGIADFKRTLVCSVCGRDEPAPVSGSWQFRLNPFILEAYRDHGTEAVIWALWHLSNRSKISFYFVASLRLWLSYPDNPAVENDVEVDAVVAVDGAVYLVEAKSSASLGDGEIKKLLLAAERIRPDVLLIACMAEESPALNRAVERLRSALTSEIKIEVLAFRTEGLDHGPFLPG